MTVGDALNGLSDWSWPPKTQSSRSDFSAFGATQKIYVGSVTTDASGDNMNKTLKLVSKMILILLTPQLALGQWSEEQEGQLVIRGGWLFDSVSDDRRPNTGIVYAPAELLQSAEGKIGPNDHAGWELEIRPLRQE